MSDVFRIGTNLYNYCDCGSRKLAKAQTCRACMRQTNARPIMVDGVRYDSLGRAAIALGISEPLARYRCKADSFPGYYYIDEGGKNE